MSLMPSPSIWNSISSDPALGTRVTTIEDKYVRSSRFASIGAGTSGTVTLPANSTVVLDDFGGTVDAVLSTLSGGRPAYVTPTTGGGAAISTTFDSSGNYSLSGTPSSYPIAIIYRVQQKLKDFDSTSSDILGGVDFVGSGGGSPGGSNTQVQYNDAGAFGADANFIWNKTTKNFKVGDIGASGNSTTLEVADASSKVIVNKNLEITNGNLNIPDSTSSTVGAIYKNTNSFIHTYGSVGNTYIGETAGNFTNTGQNNTAIGNSALNHITSGYRNIAIGAFALYSNTTGLENIAIGFNVLGQNTSGVYNCAAGSNSLNSNTTGSLLVAYGAQTLASNTTGTENTAMGTNALYANTTGSGQTAVGADALMNSTTGNYNAALGQYACRDNASGNFNTGMGWGALILNSTSYNSAFGAVALELSTGGQNSGFGFSAGVSNTSGAYNSFFGYYADAAAGNYTYAAAFGATAIAQRSHHMVFGTSAEHGTFPGQLLAGGSALPAASAVLQADSTTQGFLPPRMTNAQRSAISSPAVGLMVYCTDATEGVFVNTSGGWVQL